MDSLDNKAQTILELIFASVITVILIASVLGAFILTKQIYASSIASANLQRDMDIILNKIIKGEREPTGILRLSEAQKFNIVNMNYLQFWGADNNINTLPIRWYCLNANGTSIIYHHPGYAGVRDETIYTAPPGAALTLQFFQHPVTLPPAGPGDVYTNVDVCINLAVSQIVYGKKISGSATAMANIRNHP